MRFYSLARLSLLAFLFVACSSSGSSEVTPTSPNHTPTVIIADANAPEVDMVTMTPPPGGATQEATFDIPPEVAGHESEWPLANHDYSNNRVAVNSNINASNVANLKVAWSTKVGGTAEWGAITGNPIISDGVVYFTDLAANTYAIKLDTGDRVWQINYNHKIFGPSGPGIGYGKIFVLSRIDRYSALDVKTGKELWLYDSGEKQPAGSFQPYVFDHKVYVANQAAPSGKGEITFISYQPGSSGVASLLDAETGQSIWDFQVVEKGFWGHPEFNSGGGLWFPPAIDTKLGISYWASGNPSPVAGLKDCPNANCRPGPNLYTNSLLALDHRTGKLLWYYQAKPHDLFNLDLQVSPMLATVKVNGSDKGIVIVSGKLGIIFGIDQQTGELIWQTPVGTHQNDNLTELPQDDSITWVYPGAWGGVETPMAYADGTVYAVTTNLPSGYNYTMWDAENPMEALNRSEGKSPYQNATTQVYALEAATGKVLWEHEFKSPDFSGITVVNDLLFTSMLDGNVYALSRSDGHEIWNWHAPGGTNSWPAVAGEYIVWGFGLGDEPQMIALKLGGTGEIPTPEEQRTPVMTPEH